jgi:phosphoribosylanthranilate isomerase
MTWIKICGITNLEDALEVAGLGADAIGFIFARSPRRINPSLVSKIIRSLPTSIRKVGVFMNEKMEEVNRIVKECGLDMLQLHGEETPEYCLQFSLPVIKGISVKDAMSLQKIERYPFASILLDAYGPDGAGGTGKIFSWELALEGRQKRNFILSGGLNPMNVDKAIHLLHPLGVDVCSGVEMIPGKKDYFKLKNFIEEVKKADASTR